MLLLFLKTMEPIHLRNVCVHSRMWRLCMNETIQESDVCDDYLHLSLEYPHGLRGLLLLTQSCT